MKGLVLENGALSLRDDLTIPQPQTGEVLIRVKFASINSYDIESIEGENAFLKKLAGEKKFPVMTGIEFSGIVESNGKLFKKGDEVYGYPNLMKGQKTHQEFLTINEDYIALKPSNISFEQAAGLPLGSITSLIALEDVGKVSQGTSVLINGAAGGLGVYAVQIAKNLGAHVTAVVGSNQEDFIKSLGADIAIDYKSQSLKDLDSNYDVILELTTKVKFPEITHLLKSNGIFIPANPYNHVNYLIGNIFRTKKVGYLMVQNGNYNQLSRISKWVEEKKLSTIIDKTFSINDFNKGFDRLSQPGKKGRVILKIEV